MPHFICTTCGTQLAESDQPLAECNICTEERQVLRSGSTLVVQTLGSTTSPADVADVGSEHLERLTCEKFVLFRIAIRCLNLVLTRSGMPRNVRLQIMDDSVD